MRKRGLIAKIANSLDTKDKCFAKGGGRENEAPDWWKEKFGKDKNSKGEMPTANAATEKSTESMNYSFLIGDVDDIALAPPIFTMKP